MNSLVMITRDDAGTEIDDPVWCLISFIDDGCDRTLCSGEAFGFSESVIEYKLKYTSRGGICPNCSSILVVRYAGDPHAPFADPQKWEDRCYTCKPKTEEEEALEAEIAGKIKNEPQGGIESMIRKLLPPSEDDNENNLE